MVDYVSRRFNPKIQNHRPLMYCESWAKMSTITTFQCDFFAGNYLSIGVPIHKIPFSASLVRLVRSPSLLCSFFRFIIFWNIIYGQIAKAKRRQWHFYYCVARTRDIFNNCQLIHLFGRFNSEIETEIEQTKQSTNRHFSDTTRKFPSSLKTSEHWTIRLDGLWGGWGWVSK